MPRRFTPDPYQTLEVADPLETLRTRVTLWLLPIGAGAALLAWVFSFVSRSLNAIDQIMLWPMAVGFLGLEIYLLRNPWRIRLVWQIALGFIAAYEIASVFYETSSQLYQHPDSLSPALEWFAMVYLMAFVLLSRRQALYFSAGYLLMGIMAGTIGTFLSPPLGFAAINSLAQFLLSNLTYILLLYIFAHLRRHYAQMHQMAHTDALTGLINRRAMQNRLEAELETLRREPNSVYWRRLSDKSTLSEHSFAVLLADIDHFKEVNDHHGHAVGDQVLREVAARLSGKLRSGDQIARWGGEEFLVLAPETDLAQAQALSQRLFDCIETSPVAGIQLSLSIGVACYRKGDTIAVLLSRADEAMYRAKAGGRARIELEDHPNEEISVVHTQPDTALTSEKSAKPG
ncbi:MAG: GGDEF domain-containing protein [Thermaceae bacterium]|nr:GGDEF domain-containing protein [Thermaceae bacterium]